MSEKEHEQGSDEASEEAEETTESKEGMEKDPLSDYRTEGSDT